MRAIISTLTGFVIAQSVAGLFLAQHGLETGSVFFKHPSQVPLIILTVGQPIQIASLWLMLVFLRSTPAERFAMPTFLAPSFESAKLAHFWEKVSVGILLFLPMICFLYWWLKFGDDDHAVWVRNGDIVSRLKGVNISLLLNGWNDHQYGDPTQRTGGASFVPLWQPLLIMAPFSIAVATLSARVLFVVRARWPIRRRAVQACGLGSDPGAG